MEFAEAELYMLLNLRTIDTFPWLVEADPLAVSSTCTTTQRSMGC